jgi:integrase
MIASAYPDLASFFTQLYQPRRLIGCSAQTVEQYRALILRFGNFLGRAATLPDLDEDRISEFLAWFSAGHRPATVAGTRSKLLALAGYAQRRGLLSEMPDVSPIRQLKRAPQAYTVEHIARLLAAARGTTGSIAGIPASLFFYCLFVLAYDTGARSGAIWALAWTDYDPPLIIFRAEHAKNKADQILRVSAETVRALAEIRFPERTTIFPWPFSVPYRYRRLKAIFAAAGLPNGRRDLMQRIRRTTLTLMHNAGGDATLQAGHSDPRITLQHYIDPSGRPQAADILPRPVLPMADRQRRLF